MTDIDSAFCRLLRGLRALNYTFVTPTPATHARVISRPQKQTATSLRDIFGWSLPFVAEALPAGLMTALRDADAIAVTSTGLHRSRVRVSSFDGDLFLHSAYPTDDHDAVFFGPDSYRFARLIREELNGVATSARVLDIGTGSGIGAIVARRCLSHATLVATDINPKALAYARVNAEVAGMELTTVVGRDLSGVGEDVDIALANPPYIIDASKRAYRDGGGAHGSEVALRMAAMAVERLKPGGKFVLYSGSAQIDGRDPFEAALASLAKRADCQLRYRELDPDVFGEELTSDAYAEVERIAVVAAVLERAV